MANLLRFRIFGMILFLCCFFSLTEKSSGQKEPSYHLVAGTDNNQKVQERTVGKDKYIKKESVVKKPIKKVIGKNAKAENILNNEIHKATQKTSKKLSAVEELQEAKKLYEGWLQEEGKDNANSINTLSLLGDVSQKLYENPNAIRYYERALSLSQSKFGAGHAQNLTLSNILGTLYLEEKRFTEASVIFTKSLTQAKKTFPPQHSMILKPQEGLGEAYFGLGQYSKAKTMYELCIQAEEESDGKFSIKSEELKKRLAQIEKKAMRADAPTQNKLQNTPQDELHSMSPELETTSGVEVYDAPKISTISPVVSHTPQVRLRTAPYQEENRVDAKDGENRRKKERRNAPFFGQESKDKDEVSTPHRTAVKEPVQERSRVEVGGWRVRSVEARAEELAHPEAPIAPASTVQSVENQSMANQQQKAQDLRRIPRDDLPYIKPDPSKGLNPNFKGKAFKEPKGRFATEK